METYVVIDIQQSQSPEANSVKKHEEKKFDFGDVISKPENNIRVGKICLYLC